MDPYPPRKRRGGFFSQRRKPMSWSAGSASSATSALLSENILQVFSTSLQLRSRSGSKTTVTRRRRRSKRRVLSRSFPVPSLHGGSASRSPALAVSPTLLRWLLLAARRAQMPLSLPIPLDSIPRRTFHHLDPGCPSHILLPSPLFFQPPHRHPPSLRPPHFHQHFSPTTTPFFPPSVKTLSRLQSFGEVGNILEVTQFIQWCQPKNTLNRLLQFLHSFYCSNQKMKQVPKEVTLAECPCLFHRMKLF